jgi:DNA mismatch repair protein MutS
VPTGGVTQRAKKRNVAEVAAASKDNIQLSMFQLDDPVLVAIRDQIKGLDINSLTPLEALNKLNEIKRITGL